MNQPQNYGQYPEYYQNNTGFQPQYGNSAQYNQQYNNLYGAQAQSEPQESDGWGSNWNWGDEDNSNLNSNVQVSAPSQPASTDNVNNTESSWNWGVEDTQKNEPIEPVKNPSIDRLTGKRGKLNTPQWSVESQLSQESSDDILQTSESDKSRMLSRSSTISHSPISAHLDEPQTSNFENKEILTSGKNPNLPPLPPGQKYKPNFNFNQVNLETLPDNAEQPDSIAPSQPPPKRISPQWENNEAPINDRDQYLETGRLSDIDIVPSTSEGPLDLTDTLPPPGLRRMVLGQMQETTNPPEGLRRMIPGESSSPEALAIRDDDSEAELAEINSQPRSATIGADTPPTAATTNRSETIGADTSPDPIPNNIGVGENSGRNKKKNKRRESIEGQNQDGDLTGMVNSVRNLTVRDGSGDDKVAKKHSRQESSDSERDNRGKSPIMDRRDRRYKDDRDRDRNRGRYTPPDRDKKYERRRYRDRRYDDGSDYYSDKERDKRHKEEREYDRKYSSLRKEKDRRHGRKNEHYDRYRYEDEYENELKSRASSRSDSMHETSYRERGHDRERRDKRHKEKDRHRRPRGDPFNPYAQVSCLWWRHLAC